MVDPNPNVTQKPGESYPDQGPQTPDWRSTNPSTGYTPPEGVGAYGKDPDGKIDPTLAPHKPLSVTELKNGKMFLLTEGRTYEYINGTWAPILFAEQIDPKTANHRTAHALNKKA